MNNPPAAPDKQYLPGDFAIWIFIFAELLVFGIFFLSYAFARAHNVELFNEHQLLLDRESGAINTVILITSSFFVVCAVNAIRGNAATACARWMGLALLAGACFIGIKLQEFGARYDAGISLSTSTFFMFYLSLTFFHFMHVPQCAACLDGAGHADRRQLHAGPVWVRRHRYYVGATLVYIAEGLAGGRPFHGFAGCPVALAPGRYGLAARRCRADWTGIPAGRILK